MTVELVYSACLRLGTVGKARVASWIDEIASWGNSSDCAVRGAFDAACVGLVVMQQMAVGKEGSVWIIDWEEVERGRGRRESVLSLYVTRADPRRDRDGKLKRAAGDLTERRTVVQESTTQQQRMKVALW